MATFPNPIVKVNVTEQVAPTPSTLQNTGAFVSQGGTTESSGTLTLLTSASSLSAILAAALAVTSIAWAGGIATVTTAAAHGITSGDTFLTTISGALPAVYNGTFLATATGASTFTYALASDGGTTPATGTITYTPRSVAELQAMNTTYWAQGSNQAVYVIELGAGEPAAGVATLSTWITNNPLTVYAFLVPRSWDAVSSFLTLATQQNGLSAMLYFYVTTTTGTYSSYTALMKSVYWLVESPTTATTGGEFQAAAPFYDLISTTPSTTSPVRPFEYQFEFGVNYWPNAGNGTTLTEIKAAGGNYIGYGGEGGVANAILIGGQTADKNPVNYWYSVDWVQININLTISNAVINGSNNNLNPLYYNQPGINRLQQAGASLLASGVTFGLILNPVIQVGLDGPVFAANQDAGLYDNNTVINAVPFVNYTEENPSNYPIGLYSGFAVAFTPLRGFDQIVFNVNVIQFASGA